MITGTRKNTIAIPVVTIFAKLSKMPSSFVVIVPHVSHVCLVKGVQHPLPNSCKVLDQTVSVSRLRVILNVIPSMVACGKLIQMALNAHAIHAHPVRAVQHLQKNSSKAQSQTVNVSQLMAFLHVILSTVACGNMMKKATTVTKMKILLTC